jgi:hypothetical protein
MNNSTTYDIALCYHSSQTEQARPNRRPTGGHRTSSHWLRIVINMGGFFLCGAALLCLLATFQKLVIGAPLVIKGYIVPFTFGGLSGACLGHYIVRLRGLNAMLRHRVHTLEAFISLCSGCGKVCKPGAERDKQDSWLTIERYLSEHAGCSFTHGLCPECLRRLYPDYVESIL